MERNALESLVDANLSQREIARELGVSLRTVRKWLDHYSLTTSGKSGPERSFSDEELLAALPDATSWGGLQTILTKSGGVAPGWHTVKRAIERLEVDTTHLDAGALRPIPPTDMVESVGAAQTSDAAEHLAAAWYALNGAKVSMTSAARYDLIADFDGTLRRVQVKGAWKRSGTSWTVRATTQKYRADGHQGANGRRVIEPYDDSEIDEFFFVTGDGHMYRVPKTTVAVNAVALPGRLAAYEVNFGFDG